MHREQEERGWVGRREVENRSTGERIVIKRSSAETGGAAMVFDLFVMPTGGVAFEHYHAIKSEIFRMKRGELLVRVAGEERRLRPGDEIELPPGTVHSLVNDTGGEVHCEVEYRPGLCSDDWFMLAHAAQDHLGREPTLIEMAPHLTREVDIYPARPARVIVRITLAVLAVVSRLLGKHRVMPDAATAWHRARSGPAATPPASGEGTAAVPSPAG